MDAVRRLLKVKEIGLFVILVSLMLFLGVMTRQFLTIDNIFTVILNISFISIMACGMTMVIITAGIDLSVGSTLGLAGVVLALLMRYHGFSPLAAVMVGLVVGLAIGAANGVMITKLRLAPFIATLGMLSVGRGLAYVISGGWPISPFPHSFMVQGQGMVGFVPVPVIYMIAINIVSHIFLRYTVTGRRIYAVGGNIRAAKLVGIKTDRILMLVYMINGFLAAVSGFLITAWLGVAQPNAGQGYELDVIAASAIGGTSLMGGAGSIAGTFMGAAIMGVLRNGMILLGISSFWQEVAIGTVIIAAISVDQLRSRAS